MTRGIIATAAAAFQFACNASAALVAIDSQRGLAAFESESCVQCHAINGKGGKAGPDLGRLIDRNFTPAALAGTMWNHAPTMWAAIQKQDLKRSELDEQASADLFAYFYSARFFEKPGDAGRGKRLFHERTCGLCHGLMKSPNSAAPPIAAWKSLGDPIELTQSMWNHSGAMYAEIQKKKMSWPRLSSQDLSDLLVYFRNLPGVPAPQTRLITTAGSQGEALFNSKGCKVCHDPTLLFRNGIGNRTLTDVAAELWDHAPKMKTPPAHFESSEMRDLLSYVWANQFFSVNGNPNRGKKIFAAKHCSSCHDDRSSGAPDLSKRQQSVNAATVVSVLWRHGPQMLEQMQKRGIKWPRFESSEMSDLITYLNAKR
jgi:mono/diheme cytochrome c family protein